MATTQIFNNQQVTQPGAYAFITSGIANAPLALSFGNILIIDTGSGAGFGAGPGIAGTLASGKNAITSYNQLANMRAGIKGGLLWRQANPLFRPAGSGPSGVSTAFVVKAAATVPAEMNYSFTGGGGNGGTLEIKCKDEGLVGNGIVAAGQTLSHTDITFTTVVAADTYEVTLDFGQPGAIVIAPYVIGSTDAPTEAAGFAAWLNAAANNGGWSAKQLQGTSSNVVRVYAPNPTGLNQASDGNGINVAGSITGTSTIAINPALTAGAVNGTMLTQGFAAEMVKGTIDPTKFKILFKQGSFTGYDSDGDPYDGNAPGVITPVLLCETPEFDNIQTVIDWMGINSVFGSKFKLTSSAKSGSGVVTNADLVAKAGINKASGGTETYNSTHLQTVLDNIAELDYTFLLSDQYEANSQSADNTLMLTHIDSEASYEKFLVIGGGATADTFQSQSIAAAEYWNSDRVILAHGGPKVQSNLTPTGFKDYSSLYKAAGVLGRIAGLQPQVPATFKNLNIQGERHELNNTQVDECLDKGVLCSRFDIDLGTFCIVQGINTLQRNSYMVNEDGTSFSIAIKRIAAQLNKEIIVNAKVQLLGQTDGPNRNTLSSEDVAVWLSGYLSRKTATATTDNLILGYQDIVIDVQGDSYFVTYGFIPNFPVNKLFFTGFMLDPQSSL